MERDHVVATYSPSRNTTLVAQITKELIFSEVGVAAGDLRNSVDQEETSVLEHLAATLRPNKWTDEKHGLFLKSMEASFVNQLHDSIDLLGWSSKKNPSTKEMRNLNSSGQFKVFREGWKGNINFRRDEAEMKMEDGSSGLDEISSNPWIRRYKSECRNHTRTQTQNLAMAIEFPASPFYKRHKPRASNTSCAAQSLEVTDQNFIDEVTNKDDRECEVQSSKRIKTEPFTNQDY